jgi:hypothetical protein
VLNSHTNSPGKAWHSSCQAVCVAQDKAHLPVHPRCMLPGQPALSRALEQLLLQGLELPLLRSIVVAAGEGLMLNCWCLNGTGA